MKGIKGKTYEEYFGTKKAQRKKSSLSHSGKKLSKELCKKLSQIKKGKNMNLKDFQEKIGDKDKNDI